MSVRRKVSNLQAILLWIDDIPTLSLSPPLRSLLRLYFILSFLYKKLFLIKNYIDIKILYVTKRFNLIITLN